MADWLVLKPIPVGGGKKIDAGTVVQADGWRNRRTLESGRYIQRMDLTPTLKGSPKPKAEPASEVAEPVKAEAPKKKAGRPPKVDSSEG